MKRTLPALMALTLSLPAILSAGCSDDGDRSNDDTAGESGIDPTVGDGDGDGDGDDDCGMAAEVTLEIQPPNVMLVLDKSFSMVKTDNNWDHDGDDADDDGFVDANPSIMATPKITRWASLYSVVELITDEFSNSIAFGANLFPQDGACTNNCFSPAACDVQASPEVGVAVGSAADIIAMLPDQDTTEDSQPLFRGATPATRGVNAAINELKDLNSDLPSYVIFVTDGAANCKEEFTDGSDNFALFETYDSDLPVAVGDAFTNDNITTFVVGIDIVDELITDPLAPQANPFTELNLVAENGGAPKDDPENPDEKFYNASNQIELQEALDDIAGVIPSCNVPLDPPPHPTQVTPELLVEIYVGDPPQEVPFVESCDTPGADGWTWVDDVGYTEIILCGPSCDLLKQEGTISGSYLCPDGTG